MIWLIGSGLMAQEYANVLNSMEFEYIVVGRGDVSADKFTEKTGKEVIEGGLSDFLLSNPETPDYAIVCVGVDALCEIAIQLVDYGINSILVEKPAGINAREIISLQQKNELAGTSIYVAYNRRFYSSVIEASKIISQDGGVTSFTFEFTEWAHVIGDLVKTPEVKDNWFLVNSTHVVDTAFYLGGAPKEINCYVSGKDNIDWHKRSSVFSGAGRTEENILFSYHANWGAPGRWSLDILTDKHRLIFSPMESLQIQNLASIEIERCDIDDRLDKKYKPGLYLQVQAFLQDNSKDLCSLKDHVNQLAIYNRMAGYD